MMSLVAIKSDSLNAGQANDLAISLDTRLLEDDQVPVGPFLLEFKGTELLLHMIEYPRFKPWRVDFRTHRPSKGKDPLVKAIGPGVDHVIDATAGWGMDAARLAISGFRVTAVEQDKIVAAMLQHALRQSTNREMVHRMELVCGNSTRMIADIRPRADVVYLDPMYPPHPKSSAARKGMRILRELVGPEQNTRSLFEQAMQHARKRVVVKRPHYAKPIAPGKVGETRGKLVRFDLYKPY